MGVSTTVSLALFSLILIISLGVFVSLVAVSLRINDPARINLITDHVREELSITKDKDSRTVLIESRWSGTSYIEYALWVYRGKVIYNRTFDPPKEVAALETLNLTCTDLGVDPGSEYCINLFEPTGGKYYTIMFITREGNSFVGI